MSFEEIKVAENASVGVKAMAWIDSRLPVTKAFKRHMSEYYVPKNLNFYYIFGALAMVVLAIQIITGIFLTMHYKPSAAEAFASVEYIMRDVSWGWLIRNTHAVGASMFFIVVYMHMFRGMIYGSYQRPRELVWIFGVTIFLLLMAEAFMGYLLPWGQMSYWGAQVIINLFAAIPFIGPDLALLIRGDYVVGDATLNRFFALHVIALPLALVGLVLAHILALHEVGSNNPDGVDIKAHLDANGKPLDGIPFHPYYSVHDIMALGGFLFVFAAIVFLAPEMGGYFLEYNNFIPADPLKTPAHIAPVWYFTPFYSMLRAVTGEFMIVMWLFFAVVIGLAVKNTKSTVSRSVMLSILAALAAGFYAFDAKFWGVVVMGGTVMILYFLPWFDNSPVKSIRYRPKFHKYIYGVFFVSFVILGYLGIQPPTPLFERISQVCTIYYLAFFFLMPYWSRMGEFKTVPDRIPATSH